MIFFIITFIFLYIGRRLGWFLSKSFLYTTPTLFSVILCVLWGVVVAICIRGLIDSLQPNLILRWFMGYALGCYVSIPNFGLLNESSIPPEGQSRHFMIYSLPMFVYIASLLVLYYYN
jgi:hypothetical protein